MKKIRLVSSLIFICLVFFIFSGYRFTPLTAAKANTFVTKDYELIGEYKNDSSIFYLFKSDEKQEYMTVYVNKSNFFYRSSVSTLIPYSKDSLQTIGGMSVQFKDDQATVFVVHSMDETVDSIILDLEFGIEKKAISKDETVYFLLPFTKQIDQLKAKALDKEGNELYYYGYEKDTFDNLKWHKIR